MFGVGFAEFLFRIAIFSRLKINIGWRGRRWGAGERHIKANLATREDATAVAPVVMVPRSIYNVANFVMWTFCYAADPIRCRVGFFCFFFLNCSGTDTQRGSTPWFIPCFALHRALSCRLLYSLKHFFSWLTLYYYSSSICENVDRLSTFSLLLQVCWFLSVRSVFKEGSIKKTDFTFIHNFSIAHPIILVWYLQYE